MAKKLKISKDRKRAIVIWSFVLTMIFDIVLIGTSFQFTNKEVPSHPLHESTEPYYFTIKTNYVGPNYFFPYANLDFAVINQYNDEISGFHFFLSFDNASWVEIPLTKPLNIPPDFPPEPNFILTNVGIIPLNGFSNVLYAKCVFPRQGFDNATQTRIFNSFQVYVYVETIWTPQSIATVVLVSVALMSFIIQILDFWTKEKTEKKEERKDTEKTRTSQAEGTDRQKA
jgi:hypothetical protein